MQTLCKWTVITVWLRILVSVSLWNPFLCMSVGLLSLVCSSALCRDRRQNSVFPSPVVYLKLFLDQSLPVYLLHNLYLISLLLISVCMVVPSVRACAPPQTPIWAGIAFVLDDCMLTLISYLQEIPFFFIVANAPVTSLSGLELVFSTAYWALGRYVSRWFSAWSFIV